MLQKSNEKALLSNAWPFIEAEKILKRINYKTPVKGYVLFETGYGPSGLPHIGTFGEVLRTTMIRNAFEFLAPEIPTKLLCVSDDMDGLRKIPDNIPNPELLSKYIGFPLTNIPDPFGTSESYGMNMNNRLCKFLDNFGFDYEFKSATNCYKEGIFDKTIINILQNYEKVMELMLPTLGEERQKTYSPFLPISPKTGRVLQVPMLKVNKDKNTIVFKDEDSEEVEISVTGGNCKLQWKPDMGMRWAALDVDFEMYGKDHLVSSELYTAICKVAGGNPPHQYMYELFLDKDGRKISKSKGNGIEIDKWLRYSSKESLSYYIYNNPRKAKRLYFDVIPKAFDEYLSFLNKFKSQSEEEQFKNPIWHIHKDNIPNFEIPLNFSMLLNLAGACHAEDSSILWGFINHYLKSKSTTTSEYFNNMVEYAVLYYQDFVKPTKKYRLPNEQEVEALKKLLEALESLEKNTIADDIQTIIFTIGKESDFKDIKMWFKALYQILIGQESGPRFGSFVELFGIGETIKLIKRALQGDDLSKN